MWGIGIRSPHSHSLHDKFLVTYFRKLQIQNHLIASRNVLSGRARRNDCFRRLIILQSILLLRKTNHLNKTDWLRDGPLENLLGGGAGEVPKKYSHKGKLNEKKIHARQ